MGTVLQVTTSDTDLKFYTNDPDPDAWKRYPEY
jgi:hypothetical protein